MNAYDDKNETVEACPSCNEPLTAGCCLNVGACLAADMVASRHATGETLKAYAAPAAWTISGGVD